MRAMVAFIFTALLAPCTAWAQAQADQLPPQIVHQLPRGYDVISVASMSGPGAARIHYVVALAKQGEDRFAHSPSAPARPLLVFARRPDGTFALAGRNDHVVLRISEGGQCDPFLDGGAVIAARGRYFTVENGVACGQHWTDYVTFRLDEAAGRFVFDNERTESWSLNTSTAPDADALVRDGPQHVRRGDRRAPVAFDDWRPSG